MPVTNQFVLFFEKWYAVHTFTVTGAQQRLMVYRTMSKRKWVKKWKEGQNIYIYRNQYNVNSSFLKPSNITKKLLQTSNFFKLLKTQCYRHIHTVTTSYNHKIDTWNIVISKQFHSTYISRHSNFAPIHETDCSGYAVSWLSLPGNYGRRKKYTQLIQSNSKVTNTPATRHWKDNAVKSIEHLQCRRRSCR